jgi:hypothetical protein
MTNQPAANTDRELWRESPDYYSNSIHVTKDGGIGINVGGTVIVKSLAEWHSLANPRTFQELGEQVAQERNRHLFAEVTQAFERVMENKPSLTDALKQAAPDNQTEEHLP